jgi:long-chain acyl-CoA synthetase
VHVIVFEPGEAKGVTPYEAILDAGRKAQAKDPAGFDRRADARKPEDLATLIYTSGTTGEPKGAMLTQDNFVSNFVAGTQLMPLSSDDVALSFLPLSHVFERTIEYCYFHKGVTIAYAESIEKLGANLKEVNPTVFGAVPRVYEKVYAKIQDGLEKKTPAQKKIFMAAIETGKEILALGPKPGAVLAFKSFVFERLVYNKIRAASEPSTCHLGRAKGSRRVLLAVGVEIYEGYGLTETSPVITLTGPSAWRLGSVGRILPGVDVKIAPDGEILARGPNIMKGYLNKAQATKEAIDDDGWFHTGDIGEIDSEGCLRITDRKKELLVNANGKNIPPAPIESFLKGDPFIAQPICIGDRRKFLSVLIVPNFDKLKEGPSGKDSAARRWTSSPTTPGCASCSRRRSTAGTTASRTSR